MIKILTGNKDKYSSLDDILASVNVEVLISDVRINEIQTDSIEESIQSKAKNALGVLNESVLVDDVALYLDEYPLFPGTLTKFVLNKLGINGLRLLLANKSHKAKIVCVLGIAINDKVYHWSGEADGYLDLNININNEKMLLSEIFKTVDGHALAMTHRFKAFDNFKKDALSIHAMLNKNNKAEIQKCHYQSSYNCPFCIEFDDNKISLFNELAGDRITNRIIYEDDFFIILVPLGQFIEGGLLLLTKEHIPSFSYLNNDLFEKLDSLIAKIKKLILNVFGITPIIFEHGSAIDKTKGRCCVDHAHFNIFPVNIDVHDKLGDRLNCEIFSISDLNNFSHLENGYLYVDSPTRGMHVYDAVDVSSQLIRKIITHKLGMANRWHWRQYLGVDEMLNTINKLNGMI